MLALTIAASLLLTSPQAVAQAAPVADPSVVAPVDLDEILVQGRSLRNTTQTFVREVGAPARTRGLARWRGGLCAGVANLQNDTAQYIVDRVSDVARDVGLSAGAPGCTPNVLVIATQNAKAFTPMFVASRPRLFVVGGSGMDRGRSQLASFENSDQPVRWWHVSAPIDPDSGQIAVRIPGACDGDCGGPLSYAPKLNVTASRLMNRTEDDLKRVFIIVDVDKIANVSVEQLGDYIAMVALAQINPDADTGGYSTILNVFENPSDTPGLTLWDRTYLKGLYEAVITRANTGAARQEVVSSIIRTHNDLVEDRPTAP